ncbi:hypothetical protein [Paenibacillus sp. KS-LC4]|uniref:hypothetical protein n=1 Tax=Paenibacillus sp. KS-LC4 TaxID=2979727 RepID=UPI0030CCF070
MLKTIKLTEAGLKNLQRLMFHDGFTAEKKMASDEEVNAGLQGGIKRGLQTEELHINLSTLNLI